tara:strand:- start:220 stop:1098 length:879 start_codon:yes stop_codon:yes gene_type:complete
MIKCIHIIIYIVIISGNVYANCKRAIDNSKVVGAGGSITETIFFLNLQENLVARDLTSNFPKEALELPSIGYVRNLSSEGLLSLSPTLILGEGDVGPPNIIEQVKNTSVDFRIIPDEYTSSGIIKKVSCVGKILGVSSEQTKNKISKLNTSVKILNNLSSNPDLKNLKIMLVLMMRGSSPIVAGSGTSGAGFIEMLGASNALPKLEGWKPVSLENIRVSNPDYIIITSRGFKPFGTSQKFLIQTGLIKTNAGKKGNLIIEDGMALLGFGPRTIDTAIKAIKKITKQNDSVQK